MAARWPGYPPVPGRAREALGSIRRGIHLYEVLLLLEVLVALVGGAYATLRGGTFVGALSPVGGGTSFAPGAAGLVVTLLSGAVGIANFVLLILSWAQWRSGLKTLYREGTDLGAEHEADIGGAHRDYTRAVVFFVLNLVGAAVVAVAVTIFVVGREVATRGTLAASSLPSLLLPTIVASLAIASVFSTLMYYFAGRSLTGTIRALLPHEARPRVEAGPTWMAVGAIVAAPAGIAALYVPGLALASVVAPLVIYYGLRRIGRGYDEGLGAAPSAPPPPPVAWPLPPP